MDYFDVADELFNDNSIEDEEILLHYMNPERKKREVLSRPDHFRKWVPKEFHRRFRLQKDTVLTLLSLIEGEIKHQTERNQCVPVMLQLLIALRFYATGSFYITIGDFAGLHSSTLCGILKRVTSAIAALRSRFIKFPSTEEEITKIQEDFYRIARFPRVIAAVDGTHIRLISPGGSTAENFRNRKGFFSFNVQAICTADLIFQDVVARWPGSTHDSTIFANSSAKYHFENGTLGRNSVILGDSGYELNRYMLIPIHEPQTQAQRLYNESQIRTRNVIERCFGVWKRRFPVLSIGLRCKIPLAQDIIVACGVLHNLARSRNEGEPPVDPEVRIPVQPIFPPEIADPEGQRRSSTRDTLIEYFQSLLE